MGRPCSTAYALLLLAACCYLSGCARLPTDFKDHAAAVVGERTTDRNLQEVIEDVCYEGCFAAPVSDPYATPLSVPLFRADAHKDPLTLLDCFLLARDANLTYFAIFDNYDCYGGNEPLEGGSWAQEVCPLDCVPGSLNPGPCGGDSKASVFGMGVCKNDTAACGSSPALPPPSPVPAPPRSFRCKPGIALWGDALPGFPVKLNNKAPTAANTAECQQLCATNAACKGYYYKTTTWCYLLSDVKAWGKKYKTAVQACKVV